MRLLDTSVAVDLLNDEPGARLRAALFGPSVVSVITVVELEGGSHKEPNAAAKRVRLVEFLAGATVVPFNAPMAERYGETVQKLGFSRRQMLDRMIAATAMEVGATLVTANVDDFKAIPGLSVERW